MMEEQILTDDPVIEVQRLEVQRQTGERIEAKDCAVRAALEE